MSVPGAIDPNAQPVPQDPMYGKVKKLNQDKRRALAGEWETKISDGVSKASAYVQEVIEADKFWEAEHWDDKDAEWMPKPVENWVFATIEQHYANLSTANIVPNVGGQQPGDDDVAKVFNYVVQYLWQPNKLNMRKVIRRGIHYAMKAGTGIAKVYWNPNENGGRQLPAPLNMTNPLDGSPYQVYHTLYKGEVCVELVDPTKIIPDPSGYSLEGVGECGWITVRNVRKKDWIAKNPLFKEYLGAAELKRIVDEIPDTPTKTMPTYHGRNVTNDPFVDEIWVRRLDDDGNYHIDLIYKINGEILYYAEDLYQDGKFPFAILYDYEKDESFFGMGEAKQVIPNQKTINNINRLAALNAMHMINTQKIVTYDSGVDPTEVAKFGTMPGAVWRSRTVDGIKPLEVREIPVSVFKVAESAREGIRTIMAMDEANMGQFGGSVTAARGLELIQAKAGVRDQDKGMNVEDFVSRLTTLIISRVQQFYTTERYIPIMEEGDLPMMQQKFFPFVGSNYADVALTVNITAGSGTPINKQAIAQRAWEMFTKQIEAQLDPPLITVEELLQCFDGFPMGQRIIRRIKDAQDGKQLQQAIQMGQLMMQLMAQGIDPNTIPPEQLIAVMQTMQAQPQVPPGPPAPANPGL